MTDQALQDRAIGCLLGLAVGDALGTTLEFSSRDAGPPLNDMVGGGPFDLPAGTWTDDTAMALALADSLIWRHQIDPTDLMNRFVNWWRWGAYSATGECFDIGITTSVALAKFENGGDPIAGATDPNSAGNGSLMRLAPVAIWGVHAGQQRMRETARLQSATTHGAPQCLDACEGYALILRAAILGALVEDAMKAAPGIGNEVIGTILAGSWREQPRHAIRSTGYVAHSLEAALWCVNETTDFRSAVLLAANLGDDADTTAAITGQLAGALYGAAAIPPEWRQKLAWHDEIVEKATALLEVPAS
ncbi:MAG: ADP-ribosyl-[dinitrogen reductase] hydrolase [Cereibacter sphaeroides]|uniref:ADP-ribosyl-[dinitrogen reductase] hydrolase n=1 Tax=Cereibacter sphaeroides TaxID=1063 RepID=A0A2W5RXK9_CERSP|nr:MAG: ADP-ribosyl-[dinitrogen reductase] hydrolase [Cereibacter sphaeroides]